MTNTKEAKNEMQKLLEERKRIKKRKPDYVRQDSHKKSRLGRGRKKKQKWRRPKGRHSKVRKRIKGHLPRVEIGYGSPKKVKGTINGLKPVIVTSPQDIEKIKPDQIAFVASTVGKKKKLEIVKKALSLNVQLANVDASFIECVEAEMKQRKEKRKAYEKARAEKEKRKEKAKVKEEEVKKKEMEKAEEKEKQEAKKLTERIEAEAEMHAKEKFEKPKKVEAHRKALQK